MLNELMIFIIFSTALNEIKCIILTNFLPLFDDPSESFRRGRVFCDTNFVLL